MQVQCGCGGPAREHAAPTGATARLFVAFRCFMVRPDGPSEAVYTCLGTLRCPGTGPRWHH